MFTSRAEYRISLRQDNADERLTPLGYKIGLASENRMIELERTNKDSKEIIELLLNTNISPEDAPLNLSSSLKEKQRANKILLRPEIQLQDLQTIKGLESINDYDTEAKLRAEIFIKYQTYLEREREQADKLKRLEYIQIPENFDYMKLGAMSMESREKLKKIKPATIGQAKQISGVSPSDISVLLIHFGR
jgi:tRNA uridine 5-carboxymethylaminomethyl modification enzyme